MPKSFWLKKAAKFFLLAGLFIAVVGYVVMSLWNNLMPVIFHLPALSYWQALGLLVLSRLLLGGFGRGGSSGWARGRAWKRQIEHRMNTLSTEERENFRQQMQNRCATWGHKAPNAPVG